MRQDAAALRDTLPRLRRCALYTRKSSEEGLEQGFNSLDAQREACAAYVKSQKAEGWRALPAVYDDGGFSGGSMERPALKRLMADIAAGAVDVVVVYKIDRLTRSLADFARMVELFERHKVSFVSVTQSFNTTSSMGRLTLNVLLSFAQFEREVTGERIRDKIAASKRKGMWMGGTQPLGYDAPLPGTHRLIVNAAEAVTVRMIFERYLALGSVNLVLRELAERGITTKRNISAGGKTRGGVAFSRGALFHLLKNRLYLGEITHRKDAHPGLHDAIVDRALFEAVQQQLAGQARRSAASHGGLASAPLAGRIFDADGAPMSPTFAHGRGGRLYRYYVSAPLQQGSRVATNDPHPRRISATILERHLEEALFRPRNDGSETKPASALDRIRRIEVHPDRLVVTPQSDPSNANELTGARLVLPFAVSTRSGRTRIIVGDRTGPRRAPVLIRALRSAHAMLARDASGMPKLDAAPLGPHRNRILRLAFLAPDLQGDILAGRQPRTLTLAALLADDMPLLWREQRARLVAQG